MLAVLRCRVRTRENASRFARREVTRKPRQRARSGDGSVYQLPDGRWVASVSLGGRTNRRRHKAIRATEADALEALRKLRSMHASEHAPDDVALPLEKHLDRWLAVIKLRVRANTYRTYDLTVRIHVIKADPVLAAMRIDRIRSTHIAALFDRLAKSGVSPRMRQLVHTRLRAAFEMAVGKSIVRNPVLHEHRPRADRRTMTTWSAEQAKTFLEKTRTDPFGPPYELALFAGMRRGELLALRWRDVDFKNGRLSIQHTMGEDGKIAEPKTQQSRRSIELSPRAIDALRRQREFILAKGWRASPWVFPSAKQPAQPYRGNWILREFVAAAKTAEVPVIRFHDLRHTCATLLLQAGTHPKIVSELLGHTSVVITLDLYSHATPALHRDALGRLDAIL